MKGLAWRRSYSGGTLARPYNREGQATVRLPNRIHIVGASGSGTTSLAIEMATRYGHRHLDTDDYFWLPTIPPYREKRPREERPALLRAAAGESKAWEASGSLCCGGGPRHNGRGAVGVSAVS